jgi:hypothetical protein
MLAGLLAAGCYETEEELTINADGSGAVEFTVRVIPEAAAVLDEMAEMPDLESPIPLPITEDGLRTWFEAQGVTVTELSLKDTPEGGRELHLAFEFADVTTLLGRDFCNFRLTWVDDDSVEFTTLPFSPSRMNRPSFPFIDEVGDFELAVTKFLLRGARERSRANLPGKVEETNGELVAPNVVTWDSILGDTDYEAMRKGHTAVFDGNATTFEIPVRPAEGEGLAPEPAQAQPVVVPEAEAQDGFAVALSALELTRSVDVVSGDTDGTLEVTLAVTGPEGLEPASAEDAQIERAVTDTGEELGLARWNRISLSTGGHWKNGRIVQEAQARIRLKAPALGSTALTEFRGQFTLVCSAETREVRIAPLSAWVGRRVEHADLGETAVYLDDVSARNVTIRCSDEKAIKTVRFESEFGEPIECNSWGTSYTPGGMVEITYDVGIPTGGAVILEMHTDRKKYTIPFSLTNITLP